MIPYLIPQESVGNFKFNTNINIYLSSYLFTFNKADDVTEWDTYTFENGISIYVENNKIESIVCREELLFKGRNIIGMDMAEFSNYYNLRADDEPEKIYMNDDEIQDVYDFDNIGLQVWCKNNRIVTVIATQYVKE